MESFPADSGPGQMLSILCSIRPHVFICATRAPFQCKELLPTWARVRYIHVFEKVSMSNDEVYSASNPALKSALYHFRGGVKCMDSRFRESEFSILGKYLAAGGKLEPYDGHVSDYIRAAIQLRPALERIYRAKDCKPLMGMDIVAYASSATLEQSLDGPIQWSEDWTSYYKYYCTSNARNLCLESGRRPEAQTAPEKVSFAYKSAIDLHPTYKEWLQDYDLACKVADSFNESVEQSNVVYPFLHRADKAEHFYTSEYNSSDYPLVWLEMDPFRHEGMRPCLKRKWAVAEATGPSKRGRPDV
jgi:hypothetical protein